MLKIDQVEFEGLDCVRLENTELALTVTVSAGPRILGCSFKDGQNLFAVLGDSKDETIEYPGGGTFYLYGGHRLWYAPEIPESTYVPDNQPVIWQQNVDGISLTQVVDAPTGIQKAMQIVMAPEKAAATVSHTLTNTGTSPVELAPWAITQMKTGGVAVLPQNTALADKDGLMTNRALALWPYTQMQDPLVSWGDRFIFLRAGYEGRGRSKLGWPNRNGWLGYVLGDTMFVKSAAYWPEKDYYDFQASSQCYCNAYFLELETLGPRTVLQPGESIRHEESWQVFGGLEFAPDEDKMAGLAASLGLQS